MFSADVKQQRDRKSCCVWDANTAESASTKAKAILTEVPLKSQIFLLELSWQNCMNKSQPPEHGLLTPRKEAGKTGLCWENSPSTQYCIVTGK